MREETETIRTYYNANPRKEWDRLMKKHPYEKYITVNVTDRYIQPGCTGRVITPSITRSRGIR